MTLTFSDNILTLNGTASKNDTFFGVSYGFKAVPKDHKVYGYIKASGGFEGNASSNVTHDIRGGSDTTSLNKGGQKEVVGYASEYCYFRIPFNEGDTFTYYKISSKLIDLTLMFGEGNEPTTIEDFKKKMPLGIDEYAYNEGELISTNVEGIKSVGFNAWDEEWEKGGLSPITGTEEYNQNLIRAKNYIQILPNTIYYCSNENVDGGEATWAMFFDEQKNLIKGYKTGRKTSNNAHDILNYSFTTPVAARYMRFYSKSKVYYHDICIHLVHTGYRNGEYEPYKEFRRSIPIKDIKDKDGNQLFPNGLLSAGSVYDEITPTKAIKRIGVVDFGTLNWKRTKSSAWPADLLYAEISDAKKGINIGGIMARYSRATDTTTIADKHYITGANNSYVYVRDDSYTDTATFKAAMSGVMLYYELAEPIEVDLEEPLNLDYEVSDFGTEEVISSEPTTPMKADIVYQFNAVDRIRDNSRHTAEADKKLLEYENRISALEAMIANLTSANNEVAE